MLTLCFERSRSPVRCVRAHEGLPNAGDPDQRYDRLLSNGPNFMAEGTSVTLIVERGPVDRWLRRVANVASPLLAAGRDFDRAAYCPVHALARDRLVVDPRPESTGAAHGDDLLEIALVADRSFLTKRRHVGNTSRVFTWPRDSELPERFAALRPASEPGFLEVVP